VRPPPRLRMETVNTWHTGPVAWIEINRPDKANALGRAALLRLRYAVVGAIQDVDARVIVLTGAGDRAFAAGADIEEMRELDPISIRGMMDQGKEIAHLLETSPRPVLAAVNGFALGGGCELALACDLICAADTAQFGLPEVDLGIVPGWGGTQRLERRVGYGRARDMVLTGRRIPAAEALTWGLCDRVFPAATLREQVEILGRELAVKDAEALAGAKEALRAAGEPALLAGLARETDVFVRLFDRPERRAAMDRFTRKR
jgi:enoyl-CoA hydratase